MDEFEDLAVQVEHVSKIYRLWKMPRNKMRFSIKQVLNTRWSRLKKKNKQFNNPLEFYALNDVSFKIRKGESWGVIGLNGSGKSTLLKIISGNLRPSAGYVEVDGKVAILNYGSGFNENFTGKENVFLKAALQGLSKKQIKERYDSIVAFSELGEFINQPVKTYSSGMRARLGFAIMAHVDADILISDEALAVGDVFFVQKCMRYIRDFLKQGTFIFVSHATNEVLSLCQNAIWLENGSIKAIGSSSTVVRAYLDSQTLSLMNALTANKNSLESLPAISPIKENIKSEIVIEQPLLSKLMNHKVPLVLIDEKLRSTQQPHFRNEILILKSDAINAGIGLGNASILRVNLYDKNEEVPISQLIGGEIVKLTIEIVAHQELLSPIVGFQIMDKSGQVLFADNSFLVAREQPTLVKAETKFSAEFVFQMPLLPIGEYTLRAAIAIGETERTAIMLQTIDQALILRSVTSGVNHGLIGMPMHAIEFACEV